VGQCAGGVWEVADAFSAERGVESCLDKELK